MARIALDPPRSLVGRLAGWYSRRTYGELLDPAAAMAHNSQVLLTSARYERRVLACAEAASSTPPSVTDERVAGLRADLDDAALVEPTMMIAVENSRSRFNTALGLTGQGFRDRCELPASRGAA
jgi:alkylhydroperoxidase family enzyme